MPATIHAQRFGPIKPLSLLEALPKPVAWIAALVMPVVAAVAQWDVATIVTAATIIVTSGMGLAALVIQKATSIRIEREKLLLAARIEAKREWDKANAESLSGKLEEMQAEAKEAAEQANARAKALEDSLQHARDSLHTIRGEYGTERLRWANEMASLTDELHQTRKELQDARRDYREVVDRMRATELRVASNVHRIDELEKSGEMKASTDAAQS